VWGLEDDDDDDDDDDCCVVKVFSVPAAASRLASRSLVMSAVNSQSAGSVHHAM